jgi:hypothetical protein
MRIGLCRNIVIESGKKYHSVQQNIDDLELKMSIYSIKFKIEKLLRLCLKLILVISIVLNLRFVPQIKS